jgi:pyruvate dehydrogenase E1 component beta subunit
MGSDRRVVDELNGALHRLCAAHDRLVLLGEDLADPYGGAFRVTRGLSSAYPDRVISTPISEGAIAGAAAGLALCGDWVLMEVMFGDFITLCFDPIVNFISKSVTMYGRRIPMRVVIRCPVGGNRGYGATHSQNLHKHLLGVPNLALYELSPFHEPGKVLRRAFDSGEPAVFFEDKVLYTKPAYFDGGVDDLFRAAPVGSDGNWILVSMEGAAPTDRIIVAPGGVAPRALTAIRTALIEDELTCAMLVPSRLYPLDIEPVLPVISVAEQVLVVEDGVAGGGWSAEVTRTLYERFWGALRKPVRVVQPPCAVIPAAPHLERQVLVQESDIYAALTEVASG